MSTRTNGLTPKQQRFVQEYLKDCNGAQAAIRAGYSRRRAAVAASELLNPVMNRNVAEAVKEAQAKQAKRSDFTKDEAIRIMAKLARSKGRDVPSSVKVSAVARVSAMCGWDAATRGENVNLDLSRYDFNDEELDRLEAGEPPLLVVKSYTQRKQGDAA